MKRMLLSVAVACIAVVSVHAADEKPKYTTKQVMKFFKEEKLNEKFLKGEISKEETDALLKATKDGNKEAFGKAVNCGACHGMHKG
jgi:ribosomal protein L4